MQVCVRGCWDEYLRHSDLPGDEGDCTLSCKSDDGYQATPWSNSKPGSGWAMGSKSGIGTRSSSQAPRQVVRGRHRGPE